MGKYDPLERYLTLQQTGTVTLTFPAIEEIIYYACPDPRARVGSGGQTLETTCAGAAWLDARCDLLMHTYPTKAAGSNSEVDRRQHGQRERAYSIAGCESSGFPSGLAFWHQVTTRDQRSALLKLGFQPMTEQGDNH